MSGTLITMMKPGDVFRAHGERYRFVRRYTATRPGMACIEVQRLGGGHSMGELSDMTRYPVERP